MNQHKIWKNSKVKDTENADKAYGNISGGGMILEAHASPANINP
jgi:hypothetical protein